MLFSVASDLFVAIVGGFRVGNVAGLLVDLGDPETDRLVVRFGNDVLGLVVRQIGGVALVAAADALVLGGAGAVPGDLALNGGDLDAGHDRDVVQRLPGRKAALLGRALGLPDDAGEPRALLDIVRVDGRRLLRAVGRVGRRGHAGLPATAVDRLG